MESLETINRKMKGVRIMQKRTLLRTMVGISLVAFLTLAFAIPGAQAQAKFPSRPMTMICPFAAGGGTDAVARMVATLMEQDLGQPVNVVNRTGGGGAVGHTAGATAAPDGYTMTLATGDVTMLHWMGVAEVNYRQLRAVGLANFDASSINVRTDAPWKTVQELQDYAKANPGKLKASGTGKGGCWDIARAGWLMTAGISVDAIPWVPSSGAAPSLQDMMAGGIQVVPCSLAEARALIDAKKVKSLAIMAEKRLDLFPDVPTLKELGLNWSFGVWRGVVVPKGTPDNVVAVLEKSLEKVVKSPKYKEFMDKSGLGIMWKPAAEFDKFMAAEDASNQSVMKTAGMIK
jgi:tripartite-type tricarboxylate transporter receptor subunit TctC